MKDHIGPEQKCILENSHFKAYCLDKHILEVEQCKMLHYHPRLKSFPKDEYVLQHSFISHLKKKCGLGAEGKKP